MGVTVALIELLSSGRETNRRSLRPAGQAFMISVRRAGMTKIVGWKRVLAAALQV